MSDIVNDRSNLPLITLVIPIYFENLFRVALSSIDVFMLSGYSDTAVAAVGLIGQFTFLLIILYGVVSGGSGILISQLLGANRKNEANMAALAAYIMGLVFALVLSTGIAFSAGSMLSLYTLDNEVFTYARQYLTIYGAGSVLVALNIIQGTILRSFGYAREAMTANIIANIFNIFGNAVSLYGLFGLPVFGVPGVAVSTVLSQGIACIYVAIMIRRHKDIKIPWAEIKKVPADYFRKMFKVGIPTAGEHLSFNLAQIVNLGLIALFGTAALSANVYVQTLSRFVFMPAMSIGFATQIKAGYLAGARKHDEAQAKVFRYYGIGLSVTALLAVLLFLLRKPAMALFTNDTGILEITYALMAVMIFREIGRVANIIVIPALKGSGDVIFPVVIGIIFQWLIGTGGCFLAVYVFNTGLIGIWIALSADEIVRTLIMLFRWKSGVWKSKRLISERAE